jgi:hypothetical protein
MFRPWSLLGVLAALLVLSSSARADDKPPSIVGTYACVGENPGGKEYKGKVEITKKDAVYVLAWTLDAGDTYEGVGTVNGNILSVAWKSDNAAGLVVYKIEKADKGSKLIGKWTGVPSDGKLFNETLTFEKAGG